MTAVLFVGPTLYRLRHRLPAAVACRPPAAAGDILRAVADGAERIGLVDGVFGQVRSVWHKEILCALSRGIAVLGGASMGALRAAECAAVGMVPVGGIAAEYLAGRRVADADVAVLHGPAELDFLPLGLALVDAEDAIARWCAAGRIRPAEADALLSAARARHFSTRTWEGVLDDARLTKRRRAEVASLVARSGPGRKARDALALAARLATAPAPATRPEAVVTDHFHRLAAEAGLRW